MKLSPVASLLLSAGALGCAATTVRQPPKRPTATASSATAPGAAVAAPAPDGAPVVRIAVPADGPARGPATAKVTIVEFSDFQCPFCARANPALDRIRAAYPNDVRIVFRNEPLPFHENAALAAEAAVAAEQQGKFWEMHDKLFANQDALGRAGLEARAAELGLNLTAFRAALDQHTGKARVDADLDLGQKLGVRGTPTFFIDGRPIVGARPFTDFKAIIDDELARADALLRRGVPQDRLYATLLAGAQPSLPRPAPPARHAVRPDAGDDDAETRYRVEIAGAPARGPADAPVTIVEWADFQCPFCAHAEETMARLRDQYPGKIRFVWRDLPLPFHLDALPAAVAARAARAQGKFWAMHDLLFAAQRELARPALERDGEALGLDMKRFRAALDTNAQKAAIEDDATAGAKLGVFGTPTFFVNGKPIRGAYPYEIFKARVDAELKVADALVAAGTPRDKVYATLMKGALPFKLPTPPKPDDDDAPPAPEADTTVYPVKLGDAPSKGPAGAPLVMVVFSDFQCPFCRRVEPTLAELQRKYAGKLRVVWKNDPLPFHAHAEPAAEAALAAAAQGKFWEMHDKLFANSEALDRASLEKYAAALGLDMVRFRADLDAGRYKARVEADKKEAGDVGVEGTPTIFINGRRIAGAYPLETFQKVADAELAKAAGTSRPSAPPTPPARPTP